MRNGGVNWGLVILLSVVLIVSAFVLRNSIFGLIDKGREAKQELQSEIENNTILLVIQKDANFTYLYDRDTKVMYMCDHIYFRINVMLDSTGKPRLYDISTNKTE